MEVKWEIGTFLLVEKWIKLGYSYYLQERKEGNVHKTHRDGEKLLEDSGKRSIISKDLGSSVFWIIESELKQKANASFEKTYFIYFFFNIFLYKNRWANFSDKSFKVIGQFPNNGGSSSVSGCIAWWNLHLIQMWFCKLSLKSHFFLDVM